VDPEARLCLDPSRRRPDNRDRPDAFHTSPDGSAEVRRPYLAAFAGCAALLASSSQAASFSEISTVPYTISSPGEYRLSQDLTYAGQNSAIVIASDDVVLDLAGFTLSGTAGPMSLANGIYAWNRRNLTVRNGRLSGFLFGVLISGDASANYVVEGITASSNWYYGIAAGSANAVVRGNTVMDTGGSALPGYTIPIGIAVAGFGAQVVDNSIGETYPPPGGESVGIHLVMAPEALVSRNVVWNSSFFPHTWGMWINGLTYVVVSNNVFVRYENGIAFARDAYGRTQDNVFMAVNYWLRDAALEPPRPPSPSIVTDLGGRVAPTCTPIAALPFTITEQGKYCLVKDLSYAAVSGSAIAIETSFVTLDFNGFRLNGSAAGPATAAIGVHALDQSNITIRNAFVQGFRQGVFLEDSGRASSAHVVEGVQAEGNTQYGLVVQGRGSVVRGNRVSGTGGASASTDTAGIVVGGAGARIADNDVSGTMPGASGSSCGVRVDGAASAVVAGNRVAGNNAAGSTAVKILSSTAVDVIGNRLARSDLGIDYAAGSDGRYRDNLTSGVRVPFTGGSDAGNNQ
jgi:hypothetical protein